MTEYTVIVSVVWTLLIVGAALLGVRQKMDRARELVRNEARTHFDRVQAFRFWGASHGGVYVPPDEHTPPNPHLEHIPDRDVETKAGKKLTLMNPAYMVRQLMEDNEELYGIKGRITSLNPLRPENAPDDWERAALESFARGEMEVSEFVEIDGARHVRLMRPVMVEASCLKCHAHQGYKVGDIRGGVGVSAPAAPFYEEAQAQIVFRSFASALVWLLGIDLIFFGALNVQRRINRERDRAKADREHVMAYMQTVIGGTPDALMVINRDYSIALANNTVREMARGRDPVAAHLKCHQVSHGSTLPCDSIDHPCPLELVIATKAPVTVEHIHRNTSGHALPVEVTAAPIFDKEGEVVQIVESYRDITARKHAEARLQEYLEH